MITLGVTGGIGSGKTEFCKELSRLGAYVVYADLLAKDLMTNDPDLISSIKLTFGDESYSPNGELNRVYLAQQAFIENGVQKLNALVHPKVITETEKRRSDAERQGALVFVKEAALLLLNGRPEGFDKIILIKADKLNRIDRIQKRDQIKIQELLARIANQQSDRELEIYSDLVITNDGSLEDLRKHARDLYQSLTHA